MDGVPHEMPDAAAEVQKKGKGSPEQHDLTDPGRDGALHLGIGRRSRRRGNQPDNQHDGAGA
jgi:hypothetical protein